jgi:hypothetical protein
MSGLKTYLGRHHVALLALFVALGGTSYAAITLPANSVGSQQLKNRSIQRIDLAGKTIASLRGQRGMRGLQGPRGLQGLQGIQGVKGVGGDRGPSDAYHPAVALSDSVVLPPGDYVLWGKARFYDQSFHAGTLECYLWTSTGGNLDSGIQSYPSIGDATVTIFAPAHFPSSGTARIDCSGSTTGVLAYPKVEAMRIGTEHAS